MGGALPQMGVGRTTGQLVHESANKHNEANYSSKHGHDSAIVASDKTFAR
jgi:hypothetical protein